MPWQMIRQPNGLLARYSGVVDQFTDLNLTMVEAEALCRAQACGNDADRIIQAAMRDVELSRWYQALDAIETAYDREAVDEVVAATAAMHDSHDSSPSREMWGAIDNLVSTVLHV